MNQQKKNKKLAFLFLTAIFIATMLAAPSRVLASINQAHSVKAITTSFKSSAKKRLKRRRVIKIEGSKVLRIEQVKHSEQTNIKLQ